jgi:hypothetical protein
MVLVQVPTTHELILSKNQRLESKWDRLLEDLLLRTMLLVPDSIINTMDQREESLLAKK